MSVIALSHLGRWGNQLFGYCYARAFAEKHGLTLQTDPWIGQKIFQLNDPPIDPSLTERRDENTIRDGDKDFIYRSYSQQQKCMIYTRSQIRDWFRLRPEILEKLHGVFFKCRNDVVVGHRRVGDYMGYGYPVVSEKSYYDACDKLGWPRESFTMVTEENPMMDEQFIGDLAFLPDFVRLMMSPVLLRGNSSFSWWAGALQVSGAVYSPVIEGLRGGEEHDAVFVQGNWPRFANLDFTTDLHLLN